MTYEEICDRILACNRFSMVDVKDIPHGKTIKLNNGGINQSKFYIRSIYLKCSR